MLLSFCRLIKAYNMSAVVPYSFEPVARNRKDNEDTDSEDDGWETVSENEIDPQEDNEISNVDLEECLNNLSRVNLKSADWCKCDECKVMPVSRECLCCAEVDKIKIKKLTPGK